MRPTAWHCNPSIHSTRIYRLCNIHACTHSLTWGVGSFQVVKYNHGSRRWLQSCKRNSTCSHRTTLWGRHGQVSSRWFRKFILMCSKRSQDGFSEKVKFTCKATTEMLIHTRMLSCLKAKREECSEYFSPLVICHAYGYRPYPWLGISYHGCGCSHLWGYLPWSTGDGVYRIQKWQVSQGLNWIANLPTASGGRNGYPWPKEFIYIIL